MAKAKKKKSVFEEITLWNVCLSYPDLHDPKPFKGKVYYRTDLLLDPDHAQLKDLSKAVNKVRTGAFGEDKSEWPDGAKKKFIQDGNDREDQPPYQNKLYLTASTQTPVPIVDPKGRPFNAQSVKGGMWANVAIRIASWEFDGDEGISIYLQGVQIDTSQKSLNFGGGKSVDQMFKRAGDSDDTSDDADTESFDDEDDVPRGKKSARTAVDADDESDFA